MGGLPLDVGTTEKSNGAQDQKEPSVCKLQFSYGRFSTVQPEGMPEFLAFPDQSADAAFLNVPEAATFWTHNKVHIVADMSVAAQEILLRFVQPLNIFM